MQREVQLSKFPVIKLEVKTSLLVFAGHILHKGGTKTHGITASFRNVNSEHIPSNFDLGPGVRIFLSTFQYRTVRRSDMIYHHCVYAASNKGRLPGAKKRRTSQGQEAIWSEPWQKQQEGKGQTAYRSPFENPNKHKFIVNLSTSATRASDNSGI